MHLFHTSTGVGRRRPRGHRGRHRPRHRHRSTNWPQAAIAAGRSLAAEIAARGLGETVDLTALWPQGCSTCPSAIPTPRICT